MATCHRCNEHPDDCEILEHMRVMHPDDYGDGPTTWPDGGLFIVDETLEPSDFTGGSNDDRS